MESSLLFLGTGGSLGIPVIGCSCPVCTSTNPHNKRLRSSAILTIGEKRFLIDPGPDVRHCLIKYRIPSIDGILVTHAHEDHIGGFNDLRPFHFQREGAPLPCAVATATWDIVSTRFSYMLDRLDPLVLKEERGDFTLAGETFRFFNYSQEGTVVTGFRWGSIAYVTDIKDYPESIFEDLSGVKNLVLSALNERGSGMHFSLAEAVDFSKRSGVEQTWITHINHETDCVKNGGELPPGVDLAYDGKVIYV